MFELTEMAKYFSQLYIRLIERIDVIFYAAKGFNSSLCFIVVVWALVRSVDRTIVCVVAGSVTSSTRQLSTVHRVNAPRLLTKIVLR